MHYMLLIYGDTDAAASPDVPPDAFSDWVAATQAMESDGVVIAGDGLQPADTATTVRYRAGEEILTDGPFVESKEQLLGYYLLDLPDLDKALAWARRLPAAGWGAIEVRPLAVGPASAAVTREA